jgi:broad specificity phosphatase PhoE
MRKLQRVAVAAALAAALAAAGPPRRHDDIFRSGIQRLIETARLRLRRCTAPCTRSVATCRRTAGTCATSRTPPAEATQW